MSHVDLECTIIKDSFSGDASLGENTLSVRSLPILDGDAIVERLSSRLDSRRTMLAFDADGTLWSGDVSDDVFLTACREEWLLESARPQLRDQAACLGLNTSGSASQLGLALFDAQKLGLLQEVDLYAIMAWCYAGYTLKELAAYTEKILLRKNIAGRIRAELSTVLTWARKRNINCYVVSASPTPIVAWAASLWGFAPEYVIGTMPKIRDGVIAPDLSEDVPFGANKCKQLRRLSGDLRWLASFGDSEFDFEMLNCADLAVAVSPKHKLLDKLLPLNHAVVLKAKP